jgi:SAM-dependent methyltransferase
MLNQIKIPQLRKIQTDIESFHTELKFDIVLCAGALEFAAGPEKVFENVSDMLKTGGAFILLYPPKTLFGSFYQQYHWWLHGLSVRLFRKKEIQAYAADAGLNSLRLLRVHPFSEVMMCIK